MGKASTWSLYSGASNRTKKGEEGRGVGGERGDGQPCVRAGSGPAILRGSEECPGVYICTKDVPSLTDRVKAQQQQRQQQKQRINQGGPDLEKSE